MKSEEFYCGCGERIPWDAKAIQTYEMRGRTSIPSDEMRKHKHVCKCGKEWTTGLGSYARPTRKVKAKEITDEELAERWPRIQPIVRKEGKSWFIEPVDTDNIAYTWDPQTKEPAPEDMPVLGTNDRVLVSWAYYGFFKPTIRECLAQIPDNLLEQCKAFEITWSPDVAEDFYKDTESGAAFDSGYHTCTVVYYGNPK